MYINEIQESTNLIEKNNLTMIESRSLYYL